MLFWSSYSIKESLRGPTSHVSYFLPLPLNSRMRNHVCMLLRRFPDMDMDVLQQKYPEVNVRALRHHKYARGHHLKNLGWIGCCLASSPGYRGVMKCCNNLCLLVHNDYDRKYRTKREWSTQFHVQLPFNSFCSIRICNASIDYYDKCGIFLSQRTEVGFLTIYDMDKFIFKSSI